MRPYTGRRTQRIAELAAMNANLEADKLHTVRPQYEDRGRRHLHKMVSSIREALPEYV